jgi:hypothetical protein
MHRERPLKNTPLCHFDRREKSITETFEKLLILSFRPQGEISNSINHIRFLVAPLLEMTIFKGLSEETGLLDLIHDQFLFPPLQNAKMQDLPPSIRDRIT